MLGFIKKCGSAFTGFCSGIISLATMPILLLRHGPSLLSEGFRFTRKKFGNGRLSIIPALLGSPIYAAVHLTIGLPIHGAISGFKKGFWEGILSSWKIAITRTKKFPILNKKEQPTPAARSAPVPVQPNISPQLQGLSNNVVNRVSGANDPTPADVQAIEGLLREDAASPLSPGMVSNTSRTDAQAIQDLLIQDLSLLSPQARFGVGLEIVMALSLNPESLAARVIEEEPRTELETVIARSLEDSQRDDNLESLLQKATPHEKGIQELLNEAKANRGQEVKQTLRQPVSAGFFSTVSPIVPVDVAPAPHDNEIKRSATNNLFY